MIRLFRKIRYKLLSDNNYGIYFLYASGEIFLVAVGILFALQIDNWNNNMQETKELQGYLINIKNNLQADLTGIKEIKIFRDSSRAYSAKYLKIAKKDKITIEDFTAIEYSNYNVFWDLYFKSHQSGFEALKNSGFIGKLNGTKLEETLNEYYYVLDKMQAKEISLNNTIEAMENRAFNDNIPQRMQNIMQIENIEEFFSSQQKDIKKLINHPSMIAANRRNSGSFDLPIYYSQMDSLANIIISEIDNSLKMHNSK
jgi:hypothetical protein